MSRKGDKEMKKGYWETLELGLQNVKDGGDSEEHQNTQSKQGYSTYLLFALYFNVKVKNIKKEVLYIPILYYVF